MSSQYKENNFSTENQSTSNQSTSHSIAANNTDKIARPNIDNLIKRILTEKRKERRKTLVLGVAVLSIILIFVFI